MVKNVRICDLIFRCKNTWNLQKLFLKFGSRKNKKIVPIHLLVEQLHYNLVSRLPAIHALSGYDTTSKVGPKLSWIQSFVDLPLLDGFGEEELSTGIINKAEQFLLSPLKKTDCSTFDES